MIVADFMELYYGDYILKQSVNQTNRKVAAQVSPAWDKDHELTIIELKQYYAVDMYMDIVQRKGDTKVYWEQTMFPYLITLALARLLLHEASMI